MQKEYIIAFTSFYKAAYARDVLDEAGIRAQLKRLPPELVKSCSTGVKAAARGPEDIREVFELKQIRPRGIYEIIFESGKERYALV